MSILSLLEYWRTVGDTTVHKLVYGVVAEYE